MDSAIRLIKGVLNKYESAETDSFYDKLLDGPHYTRPQNYNGLLVPDVLVSGNHKKINDWFYNERVKKTKEGVKRFIIKNANSNGEKEMNKVQDATKNDLKKDNLRNFRAGDTVSLGVKVVESNTSRIQQFEGTVIAISSGSGTSKNVHS